MDTIVVTSVQPYTLGDECAEVALRSERGEIVAFCFPCDLKVGDVIPNRLSILDGEIRAAYLSDWPDEAKEELSSERLERIENFAYRGCGRVLDQEQGLVDILGFIVDFGDVPCDRPCRKVPPTASGTGFQPVRRPPNHAWIAHAFKTLLQALVIDSHFHSAPMQRG